MENEKNTAAAPVKLDFQVPDIKDFLKTGAQFGHQSNRWNPKMRNYIFGEKGGIHIIDIAKTIPMLENALKFLISAASKGEVIFVATKRQATEIVKKEAIEAGAHYITHRWPGGFFTNHDMIRRSLKKLGTSEVDFEQGVEGRTKYEVSVMKKEWMRLNRLYEGVKTIKELPKAIVIVDPNFERKAIREALATRVPIVAILDTNCDPDGVQYPIPANDDAVKSIGLIVSLLAKAVKQGNKGNGVKHKLVDYSKVEVKLIKPVETKKEAEKVVMVTEKTEEEKKPVKVAKKKTTKKVAAGSDEEKGLLGRSRELKKKPKAKITKKTTKKN